jgi:hypothetical protein
MLRRHEARSERNGINRLFGVRDSGQSGSPGGRRKRTRADPPFTASDGNDYRSKQHAIDWRSAIASAVGHGVLYQSVRGHPGYRLTQSDEAGR